MMLVGVRGHYNINVRVMYHGIAHMVSCKGALLPLADEPRCGDIEAGPKTRDTVDELEE